MAKAWIEAVLMEERATKGVFEQAYVNDLF